jgi:hypothetical protein
MIGTGWSIVTHGEIGIGSGSDCSNVRQGKDSLSGNDGRSVWQRVIYQSSRLRPGQLRVDTFIDPSYPSL